MAPRTRFLTVPVRRAVLVIPVLRRDRPGGIRDRDDRAPRIGHQPAPVRGSRALIPDQRLVGGSALRIAAQERARARIFRDRLSPIVKELRRRPARRRDLIKPPGGIVGKRRVRGHGTDRPRDRDEPVRGVIPHRPPDPVSRHVAAPVICRHGRAGREIPHDSLYTVDIVAFDPPDLQTRKANYFLSSASSFCRKRRPRRSSGK